MARYQNFRLITAFSLRLPRPILYAVEDLFAAISRRFDHPKREAVLANLRVILGPGASERRIRRERKRVFRQFGRVLAEFFGYERFGGRFIDRHVDIVGKEHIDRAREAGRGGVLVSAHISNWEIGAAKLVRLGYPLIAVAQRHPEPEVNELFRRQRASRGYRTIPVEGAYRPCIRAVQQNTLVCFIGDRNVGGGGVEVEFFGRPTMFPQGPARIALATGAPMIPGFVVRQPDDDFAINTEAPIRTPTRGGRRAKAHEMTQEFARIVERYVRRHPEQWGVFFRVWPEEDRKDAAAEAVALAGRPPGPRAARAADCPERTLREDAARAR